ncbi:cytochrome b5-like heme/steroid binding domain-containing protein [Pelagophyceae sp. CCMP2097]|nr:cytochrome b5-like heme/steroid binding domain-containing protein [Pelagophyceae sp. CCMP2097]
MAGLVGQLLSMNTVYALIVAYLAVVLGHRIFAKRPVAAKAVEEEEEEEEDPPRDFTPQQLLEFDGAEVEGDDPKAIYICCKGEVFDCSAARDFYGPEGAYGAFAGRDASRAFAKFSLDAKDLENTSLADLTHGERDMLDDWYMKLKHVKCYKVVGRLTTPDPPETPFSWLKLATTGDGTGPAPEGRVDAPILIAVRGNIYDVSFGGKCHYGKGGPYHLFSGKDASRALAKMSFEKSDLPERAWPDLSDLPEKSLKILADWEKLFKRKYPCVGRVDDN